MSETSRKERRLRDQSLLCERCGVNFLWTTEEQRQGNQVAGDAPHYCSGCHVLLPSQSRERGLVKWYDPRKKYGFIVRQKADEIFTHRSQLMVIGRLREGDLVEFSVVEGVKGLMAADVQVLHRPDEV